MIVWRVGIPHQVNGSDCGIYVLYYIRMLAMNANMSMDPSQALMLRKVLVAELKLGVLLHMGAGLNAGQAAESVSPASECAMSGVPLRQRRVRPRAEPCVDKVDIESSQEARAIPDSALDDQRSINTLLRWSSRAESGRRRPGRPRRVSPEIAATPPPVVPEAAQPPNAKPFAVGALPAAAPPARCNDARWGATAPPTAAPPAAPALPGAPTAPAAPDAPPPPAAPDAPPPPAAPPNRKVASNRHFQEEWRIELPWLRLSTYGCMYCSLCVERGCANSLARRGGSGDGIGTRDMKLATVKAHAKTHHERDLLGPQEAPLVRSFTSQLDGHNVHLRLLFQNVYYLAKKRCPLRHVPDLCNLGVLQGIPLHSSYRNHIAAGDMLVCLAAAVRSTWIPAARVSVKLALALDESTSIDMEGMLILYLRYLHFGRPRLRFWKIMSVTDKGAEGIFEKLQQAFEEDDMPVHAVAALSTDGANVMLGCHSGIAARIKAAWNPTALVTHCIAHRGALCAAASSKEHPLPLSEWFERCLRDIIFYFSNSTTRCTALADLQNYLEIDALKMLKLHNVRWLSREACTARLLHNYQALVLEFKMDADAHRPTSEAGTSAGGIWAYMVSHLFVFCLCAYADILAKLALISRLFQLQVITYTVVTQAVKSLKSYLRATYLESANMGGLHLQGELMPLATKCISDVMKTTYKFRNTTVNFNRGEHEAAKKGVREYVEAVIKEFESRFPDDQLMTALEIFDPRLLPQSRSAWKQCNATYGAKEMEVLCAEFGKVHVTTPITKQKQRSASLTHEAVVRASIVRHEWELLRNQLFDAWIGHLQDNAPLATPDAREMAIDAFIDSFYKPILEGASYKELRILVAIWRVQLLSSVECERGFSMMALIKTKLSNRMSATILDARMQISIEGPPLNESDGLLSAIIDDAIERWKEVCKRNVRKSHPGVAGRKPKAVRDVRVLAQSSLARSESDHNATVPTAVRIMQTDEFDDQDDEDYSVPSADGDHGEDRLDLPSQEEILGAVAPFRPPEGWQVEPAPPTGDWKPEKHAWSGLKIAHKFDNGWSRCLGTYKELYGGYDKKCKGRHKVKYTDGYDGYHELAAQTYGMCGLWVILKAVPRESIQATSQSNQAASAAPKAATSFEQEHTKVAASTTNYPVFDAARQRKPPAEPSKPPAQGQSTASASAPPPWSGAGPQDKKPLASDSTKPTPQTHDDTAKRYERRAARKAEIPKNCLLVIFDVEHTGVFKGESLTDAEVWQLGATMLLCTEGSTSPINGIETGSGFKSLVHSTRRLALGIDANGNRVGALAIAEKAGVTSVMLTEAPKLPVVMDNWLSIIKAARAKCTLSGGEQIPVVLGGHHAHTVDFRCLLANTERVRGRGVEWLQAAGVVGVLDTLKLAKDLPSAVKLLLPRTEKRGAASAKNEYLYSALVPDNEKKALRWHDAFDDACGTAQWLGTQAAQEVLRGYASGVANEAYKSIEIALHELGLGMTSM